MESLERKQRKKKEDYSFKNSSSPSSFLNAAGLLSCEIRCLFKSSKIFAQKEENTVQVCLLRI